MQYHLVDVDCYTLNCMSWNFSFSNKWHNELRNTKWIMKFEVRMNFYVSSVQYLANIWLAIAAGIDSAPNKNIIPLFLLRSRQFTSMTASDAVGQIAGRCVPQSPLGRVIFDLWSLRFQFEHRLDCTQTDLDGLKSRALTDIGKWWNAANEENALLISRSLLLSGLVGER